MRVLDLMVKEVRSCSPDSNLADAAMMMWDRDCGVLPVTDDEGHVVAMITDRDIAIAVATRGKPAYQISVRDVMSRNVACVRQDEDLKAALKTMRHDKVRRLPVIDGEDHLKGILSINDIVCRAEERHGKTLPEITYEDAMSTFKAICEHRPHSTAAKA